MRTQVSIVEWPGAGRLGMMPRPAGGEWLLEDLEALRGKGVDLLVNALTVDDRERLDLLAEPQTALDAGLDYLSFPITDFGVPEENALWALAAKLAEEFEAGKFVVAHCCGGIGRSGLIIGATLITLGAQPDQAIELMSQARGFTAPETQEQQMMLKRKGQRA